jgi:hypothetical protein
MQWVCNNALLTRIFQWTSSSILKTPPHLAFPNVLLTLPMLFFYQRPAGTYDSDWCPVCHLGA